MFEGQQISYAQVEKQLSILLIISKKTIFDTNCFGPKC